MNIIQKDSFTCKEAANKYGKKEKYFSQLCRRGLIKAKKEIIFITDRTKVLKWIICSKSLSNYMNPKPKRTKKINNLTEHIKVFIQNNRSFLESDKNGEFSSIKLSEKYNNKKSIKISTKQVCRSCRKLIESEFLEKGSKKGTYKIKKEQSQKHSIPKLCDTNDISSITNDIISSTTLTISKTVEFQQSVKNYISIFGYEGLQEALKPIMEQQL